MTNKKILLVGANGYIGSRFLDREGNKFNTTNIDNLEKPGTLSKNIEKKDYKDLDKKYLNNFDICLWLAGHSSVPMSIKDPYGCYSNNLSGLVEFSEKFEGLLVYASSASVYTNTSGALSSEDSIIGIPRNIYDYTKVAFDDYMRIMNKKYVSLRFGTVNGGSRGIREDLLLNSMVKAALLDKEVKLGNPKASRGVLYIEDLIDALVLILNNPPTESQIFNLSSINGNMENFANMVAHKLNVKIKRLPDSPTYNFQLDNSKFSNTYNYKFTTDMEIIADNLIKFYTATYNL